MRKKNLFLFLFFLAFLHVDHVNAFSLITNGDFENGFTGWNTKGDVILGDTSDPFGFFASAQGMDEHYALLGLDITDGKSILRQDFEVTGVDSFTISFNWVFDYWDNSYSAEDTFLSFISQDDKPAMRITLLDLKTKGTGFFNPDGGIAYGFFTDTIDISSYTNDEAKLIFSLVEESDSKKLTGTASVAGIDNINVSSTNPVPEPATIFLMGTGLIGLIGYGRKKIYHK